MLQYLSLNDVISHEGLRIVLVQGMPSPWGQAAKTIFEVKGLDYVAAPWVVGGENHDIVAWGGERSAPIVAWGDEKPIHRWMDILYLAERLSPSPPLIPADAAQRVLMIGLSNEICGELGIGWNRRLQVLAPVMEAGNAAEGVARMASKYRYNSEDQRVAGRCIAASLRVLAAQLRSQHARGVRFFVGDALTALDIYWTAFMNLMDPLPKEQCPMPEEWRPAFVVGDPEVKAALDPILVEHREAVFERYFRNPMEF